MIGRWAAPPDEVQSEEPRGFDDFDLRLGDVMRGERATLGKSLLDVQRELKIKATYIAAIENADPSAFETPGFIAGYVRSYARYLGLDAEWAFQKFCAESGFEVSHGLSPAASGAAKANKVDAAKSAGLRKDPFEDPNATFVPQVEGIFSRIEPGALGSSLVLIALIGFIGYGGWAVLKEVQRVQFAPVDQAPGVTAQVDPLAPADSLVGVTTNTTTLEAPPQEALVRLYRPQALDVPVLTARDGPIATLDPNKVATVVEADEAPEDNAVERALAEALGASSPSLPIAPEPSKVQVLADDVPEVVMYARSPAWVRVKGADDTVLFEKILDAGESWALPKTEEPPLLRTGYAGAIYFVVDGEMYGPAGEGASIARQVALGADDLRAVYNVAEDMTDVDVSAIIEDAIRRRDAQ